MKKNLFYFSMSLFLGLFVANVYASQQLPFFVPQKVLDKMNQPEKLPPVEQMLPDTRKTSAAQNRLQKMRNETLSEQPTKLAEEKRVQELPQTKQQAVTSPSVQKKTVTETKQEAEAKQPAVAINEPKSDIASKNQKAPLIKSQPKAVETPTNEPKAEVVAKAEKTPVEAAAETPILNNSQRTIDDIIADYKRDALGISQGKPVNNPRLRDVLQDYSDERHVL